MVYIYLKKCLSLYDCEARAVRVNILPLRKCKTKINNPDFTMSKQRILRQSSGSETLLKLTYQGSGAYKVASVVTTFLLQAKFGTAFHLTNRKFGLQFQLSHPGLHQSSYYNEAPTRLIHKLNWPSPPFKLKYGKPYSV